MPIKTFLTFVLLILYLIQGLNNTAVSYPKQIDTNMFEANQVLSCVTNNSIIIRIVPKRALLVYYEYGTTSGTYNHSTATFTTTANIPLKITLTGLATNTRYFYRIRYKESGAAQYTSGEECTFYTQRAKGSMYKFTITGDSHLYDKKGSGSMMRVTMANITKDAPDFGFEMGDTFGDDRNPPAITQDIMMQLHLDYLRYIGLTAHSSPFYFVLGNHEGESGYWLNQNPPENIAVWGTLARKYYYSLPEPDLFYTGNNTSEGYGMGLPQNYYAWEWGDALFVVLDVYRYSTNGEIPSLWDWTIGAQQYNWFKSTLESSNAKYKFVFAHHVRGYGRGGDTLSKYFEWGGYENNGNVWGFTLKRPGWAMPIHQLMVQNHVSIFFQGHDHLYAKEDVRGVIYQEVPMPSDSTYNLGMLANGDVYKGVKLNGSGHLRITVSPQNARVDYVLAYLPADTNSTHQNGAVAYTYTVTPNTFISESSTEIPSSLLLKQNYPNPFNPMTRIEFHLPKDGFVNLTVYDVLGNKIETLTNEKKPAGIYEETFDASDYPSGIYYCRIQSTESSKTIKMILLK